MKKHVIALTALLIVLFSACQTVKTMPDKWSSEILPFDFSRDGGKTLDRYWLSYFETGDTGYLEQILAYTDTEDAILAALNEAYGEGNLSDAWVEYLGLKDVNGVLTSPWDMDYVTIHLLRDGDEDSSESMKYLYSRLPSDLLIRNSVKSSAYWSLGSLCEDRSDVKFYVEDKITLLDAKTRNTFRDCFGIIPSVAQIENSGLWNDEGYGAATTYYFYDDGSWVRRWYERNLSETGTVYIVDTVESKGTYSGKPSEDGLVQLIVTDERYWQLQDREIASLAEAGNTVITDMDLSDPSELNPPRVEDLEIKGGKLVK